MSTGRRISHAEGIEAARVFARLFQGTFERWIIAGSVRRGAPTIGDVEHVVIPKIDIRRIEIVEAQPALFGRIPAPGEAKPYREERINLLWNRTWDLLSAGTITKAEYGQAGSPRWGEKYRGIVHAGRKHEIFTADRDNLGAILAIRTGPADFSKRLVTILRQSGRHHMADGYVRIGPPPPEPPNPEPDGYKPPPPAPILPCPTEADFFTLCGMPHIPPGARA